jgi:AcrR family transcriptional regulator
MATHSTRSADAPERVLPEISSLRGDQRERRQRIVDAAVELMCDVDYDRVQVKDVADRAGVALGTLYRYFNSKDHLFACALLRWSEGFGEGPGVSGERPGVSGERSGAGGGTSGGNGTRGRDRAPAGSGTARAAGGPPEGDAGERVKAVYRRAARAFERQPRVHVVLVQVQASADHYATDMFRTFADRQKAAFGAALADSPLTDAHRRDVVSVMSAVLSDNLRGWTLGAQPIAEVYAAIDRAADLILGSDGGDAGVTTASTADVSEPTAR